LIDSRIYRYHARSLGGHRFRFLFVSVLWFSDFSSAGCPVASPVRVAPPAGLRSRGEVADGGEAWLTVYPDALKKASERVRLRRLVKRLSVAKMADGELREKIGRRRSSRLSSPAIPASVALGTCRSVIVKPIDDDLDSVGLPSSDGADVVDLRAASTTVSGGFDIHSVVASDDSGEMLICSRSGRCARAHAHVDLGSVMPAIEEEIDMATGQLAEAQTSTCCDDSEPLTRPVPPGLSLPPTLALPMSQVPVVVQGGVSSVLQCDDGGVKLLSQVTEVVEAGTISPLCSAMVEEDSNVSSLLAPGEVAAKVLTVDGGSMAGTVLGVEQICCGTLGMGNGGAVSEEVRAASVARETLRSQPTDGLRQPPSSPTVPESGVEGGGRSYAAAVRPDRRSDVRLQFVPSASHDDSEEVWGSLPVGEASRFASLAVLDEDSLEDECGVFGDLDREGHRTASRCVDELLAVAEVTADGRDSDRGGKTQGRGRGGRRGRGRGGRPRGRGRS
ncbi:hypothetical protein Dimus_005566, partial [Dionaea muscipula]